MRATRVAPSHISTPAYARRVWFWNFFKTIAAVTIGFMVLKALYDWKMSPTEPKTASSGPSTLSSAVSLLSGFVPPKPVLVMNERRKQGTEYCPGVLVTGQLVYAGDPPVINPRSRCFAVVWVKAGIIDVGDEAGRVKRKVVAGANEPLGSSFPLEKLWPLGGTAVIDYVLCPAKTTWQADGCYS